MLINEVMKQTNLTKKAIEYYTEKGLVQPTTLENSYRDYSAEDAELLKKIKVFRDLDLSISEIKKCLLEKDLSKIKQIVEQRELMLEMDTQKKELLKLLSNGADFNQIQKQIQTLEQKQSISERLVSLFPGFLGRMLRLQFGIYLNEPITSAEQEKAYHHIIEFLDDMPSFQLSEELELFLEQNSKTIKNQDLLEVLENKNNSINHPEAFMEENQQWIKEYLDYKQSEAYKKSDIAKIQNLFQQFMSTSGFYDIFIPNMRKLSETYNQYYMALLEANQKFNEKYGKQITSEPFLHKNDTNNSQ